MGLARPGSAWARLGPPVLGPGFARPGLAQTRPGLAHLEMVSPGSMAWPSPARTWQRALHRTPTGLAKVWLASFLFFRAPGCNVLTHSRGLMSRRHILVYTYMLREAFETSGL